MIKVYYIVCFILIFSLLERPLLSIPDVIGCLLITFNKHYYNYIAQHHTSNNANIYIRYSKHKLQLHIYYFINKKYTLTNLANKELDL